MKQTVYPRLFNECVAEVIGTALFMFIGTGCVAALVVAGAHFGQWEISIIWGLAVALAIYAVGGVSGAHINPAVTLALASFMGFEWRKVPFYIIAQFIGSALGAGLTYLLYQPLIQDFESTHHIIRGTVASLQTAGIFTTFANAHISYFHAMGVELAITAILMFGILALGDDNNIGSKGILSGLFIGLLVAIIGASLGPLTGFAMNPARDLAPRIMIDLLGWGNVAMTGGRHMLYAWAPVVGSILGAQLGAGLYIKLISPALLANKAPTPSPEEQLAPTAQNN
ncbi:MIP/aquaporin family protein [Celerinatantimonas yamalensis]|uniref:MIP/aquaporin family protein n=1 Tax=Celerinatantimonas yamalensis TaxID=559956 RepID=A0ABW9G7E5_9GAMM